MLYLAKMDRGDDLSDVAEWFQGVLKRTVKIVRIL